MIDAKAVKAVATKYIYDKCPAVVGIGKFGVCFVFFLHWGFLFCKNLSCKFNVFELSD